MPSDSQNARSPALQGAVSPAAQRRPFYGWVVAFASAIGLGFGISVFIPATTGLLIAPFREAFGWSPPQVLFALSFATLVTVPGAPLTGALVDRFGARWIIALSFVAQGLIIASMRYIDSNVWGFYARYFALAALCTGTTAVAFSAVISRWFDKRRGLALGIAFAGVGAGGVVWSLATQRLFDTVGWRDAFLYMGGFLTVIIAPAMLLVLKNTPESMGQRPDGVERAVDGTKADVWGVPLSQAVRDSRYWLVLATFFMIACVTYGVQLNLVSILRSEGVAAGTAAAAQASIWAAMIMGRLATGWLMDRFFAPRVALGFLTPCVIGAAMLALGAHGPAAFGAAMLVGMATGAEGNVLAYLLGRYFGLRHFGAIYATQFALYAVGSSTGPLVLSWGAAATGHYGAALWVLIVAALIGMVLLTRMPRFETNPDAGMGK